MRMKYPDYMIIIETNNSVGDEKLFKFLRSFNIDFDTGICYDIDSPTNNKSCVWYVIYSKEEIFPHTGVGLGPFLNHRKYKMMIGDGGFECNCNDVDLPIIESVWELINSDKYKRMKHKI